MKVKVGDYVKFLNDVGGGKITKIVDKDTALVLNDTGFEIPYLIDELLAEIKEENYSNETVENNIGTQENLFEEEPVYTDVNDVNFYLAFLPKNKNSIGNSDCEIYLINDSNYFLMYNHAVLKGDKYQSINGILEPNVKEMIGLLNIDELSENLNLTIQLIWYDKKEYDIREPLSTHLKIKSNRFHKQNSFTENDFFDDFAYIIPVIEDNAMKGALNILRPQDFKKPELLNENEKKVNKRPRTSQKKVNKYLKEVDLHIHELIEDETGLSDHDKLTHQLEVFNREMNSAIKENYKRIVFIHGVGSGSLKLKLRSELQHKYKKYQYQDASFKEYGYGATMVLLRR